MITYLNKRKERESASLTEDPDRSNMTTDKQLFNQAGENIKVVKKWQ